MIDTKVHRAIRDFYYHFDRLEMKQHSDKLMRTILRKHDIDFDQWKSLTLKFNYNLPIVMGVHK